MAVTNGPGAAGGAGGAAVGSGIAAGVAGAVRTAGRSGRADEGDDFGAGESSSGFISLPVSAAGDDGTALPAGRSPLAAITARGIRISSLLTAQHHICEAAPAAL